ncbi:peptide chain release factor H [Aquimarina sp. TRL1]|nr:peptide chain release factor H [Aquimarina sp. TRL1]QKX03883.1 peptide chain release factor H [Aquimarina sp. TRL1]
MEEKTIQITAARGPAECWWVVAQVLKRFLADMKEKRMVCTVLHKDQGVENGTIRSVIVRVSGEKAMIKCQEWIGTIQWIGTSRYRKYHKRKNWFIGVHQLEESKDDTFDETQITYQTMKSSGPGGQHVNKVNSAVRAIHKPTGVMVVVMDRRSQHQNRKIAKERLEEKVKKAHLESIKDRLNQEWDHQVKLSRGNPVKVFTGSDFKKKQKRKTYKDKRNQLKRALRNTINE